MIVVFNMTATTMALFVNRGQVPAPDPIAQAARFKAYPRTVALEKYPGPQVFAPGQNTVSLRYDDYVPPLPTRAEFQPTIPDTVHTDFILYLFGNGALLMRNSGETIDRFTWGPAPSRAGDPSLAATNRE